MEGIRTNAAAAMLGVSPNTLRSWERRYGFPRPVRSSGGHRQYALEQLEALRATLKDTHNISSAIALARARGAGPGSASRIANAMAAFDEEAVGRLLEESLAVRSCERTVEELLLPAVAELAGDGQRPGAEYGFAWRQAAGWLSAQRRLTAAATRPEGVLLLDSSAPGDIDALYVQALELCLRRAGLRTLAFAAEVDPATLGRALRALAPQALVLGGAGMALEAIGKLVYTVRRGCHGVRVFDFRGAIPGATASTVARLGEQPIAARDLLLGALCANGRSDQARRECTEGSASMPTAV
jgi:DNA-binding transcriptional MerR regulator